MHHLLGGFAQRQRLTIVGLILLIAFICIPLVRDGAKAQNSPRIQIESDSSSVSRYGNWSFQQAAGASGGSYLYSSGSEADILTFEFNGSVLEVVYVAGPSLGTLAIEVDGTVLRTVITQADTVQYQMRASVNYLEVGIHNARIYAQEGGVIGVDAFAFEDESTGAIASAPCNINEPVVHRVSLASDYTQSNGYSYAGGISGNGRYVTFVSRATNLVPNDTNGFDDIFVYDRQTCDIERVSVSSSGTQANQRSDAPQISDDGRYIVFVSLGNNLHPADTDNNPDIYLHDRQTHQTQLLTQMVWSMEFLAFSGNGQYILLRDLSWSNYRIYRMDVQTGQQVLVSSTPEGNPGNRSSFNGDISYDGRYTAFDTESSFSPIDTNILNDIYVRDLVANTITLVTFSSSGAATTNNSYYPKVSDNGRYVSFLSLDNTLIEGDSNGFTDVFVRDLQVAQTTRVSVSSTGTQANNYSSRADISGDGRYITFLSNSGNLVADDTNNTADIFLYDTQTGITTRLTVDREGVGSSGYSEVPSPFISSNGLYITFNGTYPNLVPEDTNGVSDVFVTAARETPIPTNLTAMAVSQTQINLAWTDNSDETEFRVERRLFGSTLWTVIGTTLTDVANYADNGVSCFTYEYRVQAYQSTAFLYSRYSNVVRATPLNCSLDAPNLQASAPNYHTINLGWMDNATTETQYIVEISPNGTSDWQEVNTLVVNSTSLTHTQRFCATTYYYRVRAYRSSDNTYSSYSNVASATTLDCQLNEACHQSSMFDRPAWAALTPGDGAVISRTGRYVAFSAEGSGVAPGDTSTTSDVFLTDMQTCQILLVSVNSNNETGNAYSGLGLSVTPDGRYVTFRSAANNLTPGDSGSFTDIFVRDMFTGQIVRASRGISGAASNERSNYASISDDGRYIVFMSEASNLVPNDTNHAQDAFLYDRQTDTLARISVTENGSQSSAQTSYAVISGNGRYIAFDNRAPLVAPDDANSSDIFIYDLQTGILSRETSAYDGGYVSGGLTVSAISYDGRYLGLFSTATNFISEDDDGAIDVVLLDRQTDTRTLVSVATDGEPSNDVWGHYLYPMIQVSDDGRFVAFVSSATNLVPNDTNQCNSYNPVPCPDVFLRDLQTSTTLRISVTETWQQASGYSFVGGMSGDGRFFLVSAEDALTSNGNYRLYLFKNDFMSPSLPPLHAYEVTSTQISILWQDFRTDETEFRVERSADGLTGWVEIGAAPANQTYFMDNDRPCGVDFYYRVRAYRSSDGAFSPYTNVVQARTTCAGTCDTQATTMQVSVSVYNTGNTSFAPDVSGDGRYVVFVALGDGYVYGQSNNVADVYIQDRQTCTIEIVSIATSGDRGNGHSSYFNNNAYSPAVSDDGRYVVFSSSASNLVIGDFNQEPDIFLRDRLLQQTVMISALPDGTEGNDSSGPTVDMSADGRYITFATAATNLAPGSDYALDIMLYDRQVGMLERITEGLGQTLPNSSSLNPQISADGRYITFTSYAGNLVPDDTNTSLDVFLYDHQNDDISRINLDPNGQQVAAYSGSPFIPAISANGHYIAFPYQDAGLVSGDTNGYQDIFLYDDNTHTISIVSRTSIGFEANNPSSSPSISGDGRYVTFSSTASNINLDETNDPDSDIFVFDRQSAAVYRVSLSNDGSSPNGSSYHPVIAAAGGFAVFDSRAGNLVTGDTNGLNDVFMVNLEDITPPIDLLINPVGRTRIDLQWSNPFTDETAYIIERRGGSGSGWVELATMDSDQTFYSDTGLLCDTNYEYRVRARFSVSEFSAYSNLAYATTDHCAVTCRPSDAVHRVSIATDGTQGNQLSGTSGLSADGRYVLFVSTATNLASGVQGLSPSNRQLYLHDRQTCITTLISRAPDGTAGNGYTAQQATISDNGRYIGFTSASSNLVPGDTNGVSDTFLFDTQTNSMTRISVAADGTQQNNGGSGVDISADGRFVVFASYASNLVSNDNNSISDIFLYDRQTNGVSRLSNGYNGLVSNGSSASPRISPDGRYVVFTSRATNLLNIPSDPSSPRERVYQRDLQTNQLTLVSVQVSGTYTTADSFTPDLSNDGRYVVYSSYAPNLVVNDTNGTADVFLWDSQGSTTTRISVTNTGSQINSDSLNPTISGDGRFIVFSNPSSSIGFPDGNGVQDVFLFDRQSSRLFLVSTSNGIATASGASQYPMISNNGLLIEFESLATSFITGDTNGYGDVFVAQTPTRIAPYNLVLSPLTPLGVQLTWADPFSNETGFRIERSFGDNIWTEIGAVGSNQTTYTDTTVLCGRTYSYRVRAALPNNLVSLYSSIVNVITSTCNLSCSANSYPQRLSVGLGGVQANGSSTDTAMTADGRYVAFVSSATNLISGDTNSSRDVFVLDRQTSLISRVSIASDGTQSNGPSDRVSISVDGRFVAFTSTASNLVVGDNNGIYDVFVYDRQTGQTTRVSVSSTGTEVTGSGSFLLQPNSLSNDGRYVVFSTYNSTLVANDTNSTSDVFVHDRQTGQTRRVSVSSSGEQGNSYSFALGISGDGRYVMMMSGASTLVGGDTNNQDDLFVHDLQIGQTTRFNLSSGGLQANGSSSLGYPHMTADHRYILFDSAASNLVSNDTNGFSDLFMRDFQTNQTSRVLLAPGGQQPNGNSALVDISADGNYLLFISWATNLVSGDTNGLADLFLLKRSTGQISRVSTGCDGGQPNQASSIQAAMSDNAQIITFQSNASNLVANDTNGYGDIFLFTRPANTIDALAIFNSNTHYGNLIYTLENNPTSQYYTYYATAFPYGSGGQYVMGDWDGNGTDTVGVYRNGGFFFTNDFGTTANWTGIWFGLGGQAVAGHFDDNVGHTCIGVTDSGTWTTGDTYFAFYFTCNLTSGPTPPLTFQWLSIVLPNSGGLTGTHQFAAGDFDGDGVDSIAIRRGAFIAWTNVPPTTLLSEFSLAQYIGIPGTGDEGQFVAGDWNFNHLDSFGLVYQNGWFYRRDDLQWNSQLYILQRFTPLVNTPFSVTTWRPN